MCLSKNTLYTVLKSVLIVKSMFSINVMIKKWDFHPCWYISWPLVGTRADNEGRPHWLLRRNRWTTVHKWLKYNAWPRVHCSLGSNSQELHPKAYLQLIQFHCMPMSISKSCCRVLQSQAERSRVSRQISLTPDTYSSISTHKYSTKVSQTTLAHPHKPTLLHTHSIKAHLLIRDWLCNSVIADGGSARWNLWAFTFAKEAALCSSSPSCWSVICSGGLLCILWVMMRFLFSLFPLTCFSLALCFLGSASQFILPPCPPLTS